jgi:RNA ligase (TIGR02306 family)
MRKLASLQVIESMEPIPGADAIAKAKILGWAVVVKKSEFQVGDRVVYCEIDSLLPERPEFEFLRASSFKPAIDQGEVFQRPAGFRIKTVRLRGQVSEGICFPLSILPPGTDTALGSDVTEILGILKFEAPPPVGMAGRVKGGFPGFISKTDETRVQLLEECLAKYQGMKFVVTEKLDGTSFTAYLREGEFGICSRNLELDASDLTSFYGLIASQLKLEDKLRQFREKHGFDIALQGEIIGLGVQGNKYKRPGKELHIFSVLNLSTARLLDHTDQLSAIEELGLTGVPVLETITLKHTIPELVAYSEGMSRLNPDTHREGIVLRPESEVYDEFLGGRLSFKVINPKFLLKYDE